MSSVDTGKHPHGHVGVSNSYNLLRSAVNLCNHRQCLLHHNPIKIIDAAFTRAVGKRKDHGVFSVFEVSIPSLLGLFFKALISTSLPCMGVAHLYWSRSPYIQSPGLGYMDHRGVKWRQGRDFHHFEVIPSR